MAAAANSSSIDNGKLIYSSELFKRAFPHRFELEKILSQGDDEAKLKNALHDVKMGDCSDKTEGYLQSLSRECTFNDSTCEDIIHIFFKKLSVSSYNLDILAELSGRLLRYERKGTDHRQCLENDINKILALKRGCNVMLLYNINETLKNGL